MTATIDGHGQLVLRFKATDKPDLRPGDVLVVDRDPSGNIILKKRRRLVKTRTGKSYLNPAPLAPGILEKIYGTPSPDWDKIEGEAVLINRRALVGKRVEDL